MIHATQNTTELLKTLMIAVIMECTYFLPYYMRLGKYEKIQHNRTCIKENTPKYRVGIKINPISKKVNQNAYQIYPQNIG